jgi:hypothetical protein
VNDERCLRKPEEPRSLIPISGYSPSKPSNEGSTATPILGGNKLQAWIDAYRCRASPPLPDATTQKPLFPAALGMEPAGLEPADLLGAIQIRPSLGVTAYRKNGYACGFRAYRSAELHCLSRSGCVKSASFSLVMFEAPAASPSARFGVPADDDVHDPLPLPDVHGSGRSGTRTSADEA